VIEVLLDHEVFLGHLALKGRRERKETKVGAVLWVLEPWEAVLNREMICWGKSEKPRQMPRQRLPRT
jgi:hypothetical protein